ncbi:MAG: hypothetical protein Q8858_11070, partial [Bacteroidota bacterium]|nr:hypothetical protein [Bacteroidota bacterium]
MQISSVIMMVIENSSGERTIPKPKAEAKFAASVIGPSTNLEGILRTNNKALNKDKNKRHRMNLIVLYLVFFSFPDKP